MNHPAMVTPLTYEVSYRGDELVLVLVGPDGIEIPTRDVSLQVDTLRFIFDEPEVGVALQCALGRLTTGGFEGRCTDAKGKWARFTMHPPSD